MKGFIHVVEALIDLSQSRTHQPDFSQTPEQLYIPLSDIVFIKWFPGPAAYMSGVSRNKVMNCLKHSDDRAIHNANCIYADCVCFAHGIPERLFPVVIIVVRGIRVHEEFLVYPNEENRRILREGDTTASQQTEMLHQILLELQYGSTAGSGYSAAHKRFRLNSENEEGGV